MSTSPAPTRRPHGESAIPLAEARIALEVPVAIIGGGGCGLAAALAAHDTGAQALVIERDVSPAGSTAMSTGLIPAAGSRFQRERGIADDPECFIRDVMRKTEGQTDESIVATVAHGSARTVEWLCDAHGVQLSLLESFLYPGHSVRRMHGTPNRTGSELMAMLLAACGRAGIDILTEAVATELFVGRDDEVCGVRIRRPGGETEDIGCRALVLACSGFAGNPELVARYIPEVAGAEFFGHPGNKGDALRWGDALGAAVRDLGAYQGHGGLAAGRGIPILWPLIMEGGIQVNGAGVRFSNEARGYSEQAVEVVRQAGSFAWTVFDDRLHELMLEFQDYRDALESRAVIQAADAAELARSTQLPELTLGRTLAEVASMTRGERACPFGRDFRGKPVLHAPYRAVKVHGALFHTQGGLAIDTEARVLRDDGSPFPNLFAGGGAARGISGPSCWGYIAGNGLLTATTLGRLAGEGAARLVQGSRR